MHAVSVEDPMQASVLGPREVRVGDGAVEEIGPLLTRWGVGSGKVMIVCDAVLVELGIVGRVSSALKEHGYIPSVFDEVAGEPTLAVADSLGMHVRRESFSAVVGIGGGSAMDLAKVGAALATNPGNAVELVGVDTLTVPPVPLVLIPTTAGTGSEATRIAMLTDGTAKAIVNDARLVPLAAVLDPSLVSSLPKPVTAATGMDALSHAVESMLSTSASMLSLAAGSQAAAMLSTWLPDAFHGGGPASRRGTLYGAFLAGIALNAGVVLGHSIAYTIANRTGLPHGVTSAMALPYCVAYNARAARGRLEQIAELVQGTDEPSPDGLCRRIVELNRELGIPQSLRDVGIPAGEVPRMALECQEKYPRPTNPADFDADALESLYRHLWAGASQEAVAHFG